MHISFKIGYLQRTCDLILAAVTATPVLATAPTPVRRSGRTSTRIRDRLARIEINLGWGDIKRLYGLWRNGPWGLLGLGLWGLAKWLGVL